MKSKIVFNSVSILFLSCFATLSGAGINEDVSRLQSKWAEANYSLKDEAQEKAFEELVADADKIIGVYPDAAEALIWDGIIKSSYAGVKGGLGALGLVKDARVALEKAITINPDALQGSAYTSLGALYSKVPGWPIAFGDDDKAESLLKQALKINPEGIDSNYFYAEFLLDNGDYTMAESYLLKAQHAAPRPGRALADKGRQEQISSLLSEIKQHRMASTNSDFE